MTLLQTLRRNSLINLTSACEIVSKASFQSACETFLSHRPNKLRQKRAWLPRGNVLPLPNYRRIFFYFLPFFLPSFTVKSGSVTGCSIKIYRPGEKTREREREGGKRKKNAFHRPDLAFPFYSRFLLSRDRRRAGLSNHAKNNESQRRYSVSQWFTVDGFKSISSVKYKCFGYFQIFTKAWEEWWDPVMIDGKSKIVFINEE